MYDYIKPLLRKCPDNIILHVGTNNTVNEPSKMVLDKLLNLKKFIEHTLSECNVVISNLITWTDNGKPSLTVMTISINKWAFTSFTNGCHRQWKYNFKWTQQRRVTFKSKRLRQACYQLYYEKLKICNNLTGNR